MRLNTGTASSMLIVIRHVNYEQIILYLRDLELKSSWLPTCRSVERSNLLSMLKIAIKGLIETSMRMGRTLNDSHPKLQQFLILMELVFKHRLKCRSESFS